MGFGSWIREEATKKEKTTQLLLVLVLVFCAIKAGCVFVTVKFRVLAGKLY